MMKHRILALGLAACLSVSLCACGGSDDNTVPEGGVPSEEITLPSPDVSLNPSEAPAESSQPSVTPDGDVVEVEPTPVVISDPTAPPTATPAVGTPTAEPVPDQHNPVGNDKNTAKDVYALVSASAGVSYDNTSDYVDSFYTTLSLDDVEDYAFYMPGMSTQIEEIFIAKVKSGKMDAVKTACRDRQAAMAEEAAFYGTTGQYVDNYQLVSEGDWVLFCVCEKASAAVSAFQSAVK